MRLNCVRRAIGVLLSAGLFAASAASTHGVAAAPMKPPVPLAPAATQRHPNPPAGSASARSHPRSHSGGPLAPQTAGLAGAWNWQNPLPNGESIFAVACPIPSTCFAGVSNGQILGTANGGATWALQSAGTGPAINAISCASPTSCVAVGDSGVALRTSNGGGLWASVMTNGGGFLGGVSCPSVSICFAVGSLGSVLMSSNGGGMWATQTSATNQDLFAISCPTTTACWAVGAGVIIATVSAGATWSLQATSPNGRALFGIACPSFGLCDAVGDFATTMWTNDGGTTWPSGFLSTATITAMFGVSCANAGSCYAAGADGSVYVRFGTTHTWARSGTGAAGGLNGISCTSSTSCIAVGDYGTIVATSNGGTGWSQQSGAQGALRGISCPSTTTCFAVAFAPGQGGANDSAIYGTTNSGSSWTQLMSLPNSSIIRISCPSASVCFAGGSTGSGPPPPPLVASGPFIARTTDGGAHWSFTSFFPPFLGFSGISCPSVSTCVSTTFSGVSLTTTDGGANWGAPSTVTNVVSAISCPTTTTCYAVDAKVPGSVFRTTNAGTSWSLNFDLGTDPNAGTPGAFYNINCPSSTTCYAVGSSGVIATTTDGVNWRTDFADTTALLLGVSCPSASTCFVATDEAAVLHTTNYGESWQIQFANSIVPYRAISCPTTSSCFAAGDGGIITATTTAGAAWSRESPATSTANIRAMSCPSTSDCYAAAFNTILVSHDGGNSWSTSVFTNTDEVVGISCPAPSTCFAVGWPGAIYFTSNGGVTWTYQPSFLSGSDQTLVAVSCSSATTCVAVGTQGNIISTTNGSTWAAESSGTTPLLTGVSCTGTTACVAVGLNGLTMARTGGSWLIYPSGTNHTLLGVACSASVCYAVGRSGTVIKSVNGGVSWTAQTSGTATDLLAIACPYSYLCLASGALGTAILSHDGSTWADRSPATTNRLLAVAFPDPDHAWVAGAGGTILFNSGVPQFCIFGYVVPSPGSPQLRGTVVQLTASSSGCANPQYAFYVQYPNGTWYLLRAFGPGAVWNWDTTGLPLGMYLIHAWASQAGATTWQAIGAAGYTLQALPGCASAGLTPSNPSQAAGSTVNLTASSTVCPNPQYEFWVQDPSGIWTLKQPFGGPTFNWDTTGLAPGKYTVHAWADQSGDPTSTYEAIGAASVTLTGCTAASLSPPTVNAPAGSTINLTASSSGCTAVYEFWVQDPSGTWTLQRGWGGPTFAWDTTGLAAGTYTVHAWANQTGAATTLEAYGTSMVTLTNCLSASIAPPTVTQGVGTTVNLTASSNGCLNPRYAFYVQDPSGNWTLKQGFGGAAFNWDTSGLRPGVYTVHAWVNTSGNGHDAIGSATVTLTGCTSATVAPSSGSAAVGTHVLFTVTSTAGCTTAVYEFWLQYPDGSWHLQQPFSTTNSWTWDSTGRAKGNYVIHVWVNNQGADTSLYETIGSATYTLT